MGADKEIAAKWIALTERDLKGAHGLYQTENYELACYHCQQALEKILKAYLFAVLGLQEHEKKYRIHDLLTLLEYSKLEISVKLRGLLENLNPITKGARYEIEQAKALARWSRDMCAMYISQTEEFICLIKSKLN